MICEYYNASLNPSLPNNGLPINHQPINLDLCQTFRKADIDILDSYEIVFYFPDREPIKWKFINSELRDLEFDRALRLIKSNIHKAETLNS